MPQETYMQLVLREMKQLKNLADGSIQQLSDDQFGRLLRENDNSIAIIVKHMAGNMRSRWRDFLTSDGEKPDRNRDDEFRITSADTRAQLHGAWENGWNILFETLASLEDADLPKDVTIRGESLTAQQAIGRQLTHYAYHVGQIVYVAKHLVAESWTPLSIAKGKSKEFNKDPKRYLDDRT